MQGTFFTKGIRGITGYPFSLHSLDAYRSERPALSRVGSSSCALFFQLNMERVESCGDGSLKLSDCDIVVGQRAHFPAARL